MNSSSLYIYNASAGSGKTYSLVKAYLKALMQSKQREPFKNALAITFTNKAVSEMKERIISALKDFSSPKIFNVNNSMFHELCAELEIQPNDLHEKSQNLLYSILKNYAAFDVSTIDKFNQKLIRVFAYDLKLPLNFEVELDTDSMLNKAVDNLISKAGSDKQLTNILLAFAYEKIDDDKSWDIAYDLNKVAKLLVKETEIPYLETLKYKSLNDFDALKSNLKKKLDVSEKEIVKNAENILSFIEECGLQFDDFTSSYLPKYFFNLSQLKLYVSFGLGWQNKLINNESLYPKRVSDDIASIINNIQPDLISAFIDSKELVIHHKFLLNFYKNILPLSLLNLINNELIHIKEDENKLLISEFNSKISDEVKNQPVPFIYERIGEKFKHYFIDEFQDTSQMQWENLIPLICNALSSENASVMLVGDAKQAIYRWRGGRADLLINLFNQTEKPCSVNSIIKSLDTNYRSSETIIEFNNSFFEHLSTFLFADTNHKDLYQNSSQNKFSDHKGYVNLSFLEITRDDNRDEVYPKKVLEQIQKSISLGYNFDDICILVRKTKEGAAIANYLSDHDIDIVSQETLAISRSAKVNFILSTLNYLINPSQKEYKIQVLQFLAEKLNVSNKHVFYSARIHLNIYEFYQSINEFNLFFKPNEAAQLPVYELVETIIYEFKLVKNSNAYVQFFLDFVFNYSNKNYSSVSGFLDYYEQKKDKLKIASSDIEGAVKIMTIHKSKGLEFPIVIFPYADLDIYKEIEPKVWFSLNEEEFNGFSYALLSYNKDIAEFGKQGLEIHSKHQAELELDNINLLYVALTRAVEQLYIISNVSFNSKGGVKLNEKQYSGLLINYLHHIGKWDDTKLVYTFGNEDKPNLKIRVKKESVHQKEFISIPKKEHDINVLTKAGLLWDTSQKQAIEKGNLIHDIMAQIKTDADIDITLNSFNALGIINSEQQNELKSLIISIVSNKKLKPYFSQDFTIYNERDIITKSGIILRPDRLAIDNTEVVIMDYKTGKADKKHLQQLQTYQDALEEMNFSVIKKILIYLNEPITIKEV